GLEDRDRTPVQGHRSDSPGRLTAARQPRAVRDVAAVLARLVSRDRPECCCLPPRRGDRAGADRAGQLRAREADRPHDAAARARDRCGRAGRRPDRARARARVKVYFAGPLFTPYERGYIDECAARLRGAGFDVFVPHEHELALTDTVTAERIFAKDWIGLSEANAVLALLDGPL